MERAIKEQKQEIESRDVQSAQHGQKLENLEEQAELATQQVRKLEASLAECHKEIEMYVEQLKDVRAAHEQELEQKRLEVRLKYKICAVRCTLNRPFPSSCLLPSSKRV